jgi:hypothetical protein
MNYNISRRAIAWQLAAITVGSACSVAMGRAAAAADALCADPSAMDSGQQGLRASLNYTESSPDHAMTCSLCAFYQATNGRCGNCTIFNGPANPVGRCDSWSAKS